MQDDNIIERTVRWVTTHVSHRQLLLLLAFIVGFLAALAAYILHSLIHIIQHMLSSQFASEGFNWFYLVCPVIGILLTMLFVRYIVRDNISHGITRILYSFST